MLRWNMKYHPREAELTGGYTVPNRDGVHLQLLIIVDGKETYR